MSGQLPDTGVQAAERPRTMTLRGATVLGRVARRALARVALGPYNGRGARRSDYSALAERSARADAAGRA